MRPKSAPVEVRSVLCHFHAQIVPDSTGPYRAENAMLLIALPIMHRSLALFQL
jgi:hypothetical protein